MRVNDQYTQSSVPARSRACDPNVFLQVTTEETIEINVVNVWVWKKVSTSLDFAGFARETRPPSPSGRQRRTSNAAKDPMRAFLTCSLDLGVSVASCVFGSEA